jgi:hypothetical protein
MSSPATAAVRLLSGEREPCRVATTVNIALAGLQSIDNVPLAVNDRVLVKDQTDPRQNGIYTASTGDWYRASDARDPRAITEGVTVQVQAGSVNAGKAYRFRNELPVVGTDPVVIDFYLSANFAEDAEETIDGYAEEVIGPLIDQVEAIRDTVSGLASDAVSQGNVPIYSSMVALASLSVPAAISALRVNGRSSAGDNGGGLFVSSANGSPDTFVSGDGRTWYRARELPTVTRFGAFTDIARFTTAMSSLAARLANYAHTSIGLAYSKHPFINQIRNSVVGHFIVLPADGGDCAGWAPALYVNDNATTARPQPYTTFTELPQEREGTPKTTLRQGLKVVGVGDTIDYAADRIEWEGDFATNDPTLLRPVGYASSNPLVPDYNQPVARFYGRAATLDPFNTTSADDGVNGNPKAVSDITSGATLTVAAGHGFVPGDRLWLYGTTGGQVQAGGRGFVVGTASTTAITLRTLKAGYYNIRMDSAVAEYSDPYNSGTELYIYRDNTPRIRRAHWWVGLHLPGRAGDQRSGTIQSRHIVGPNYENDGKYGGRWEFLVSPLSSWGEEKPVMYLRPWEELSTGNTPLSLWFAPTGGVGSGQERRVTHEKVPISALTIGGGTTVIAASTTAFLGLGGVSTTASNVAGVPSPVAGNITGLLIRAPGSIGTTTETWTVTLRKNGSATALTFIMTGNVSSGQDLGHTVSVDVGDVLDVTVVASAGTTPRPAAASVVILPAGKDTLLIAS